MSQASDYAVARVSPDRFRIDRTTPPNTGTCAFVDRVLDRRGAPLGWQLKPLVVMQGAKNRIWPSAAAAIASTKLLTTKQAKSAIACADVSAAGAPP